MRKTPEIFDRKNENLSSHFQQQMALALRQFDFIQRTLELGYRHRRFPGVLVIFSFFLCFLNFLGRSKSNIIAFSRNHKISLKIIV